MLDMIYLPHTTNDIRALVVLSIGFLAVAVFSLTEMLAYVDRAMDDDLPDRWAFGFLAFYVLGSACSGAALLCIVLAVLSNLC